MITEGDGKINDTFQKAALCSLKVLFFGFCEFYQPKKIIVQKYLHLSNLMQIHMSLKYVILFVLQTRPV